MDYQIAIASYQRPQGLLTKTLRTLRKSDVDLGRLTVFVADTEQEAIYREALGSDIKLQLAVLGMREVRNFIRKYYPQGTKVLSLDDDITGFRRLSGSKKLIQVSSLNEVIEKGFKVCQKYGNMLWGVYPVANPFFMKNTISLDLKLIPGWCFGYTTDHDPSLDLNTSAKEDYERTMMCYVRDGAVVRLNYICAETTFVAPGGMEWERDEEMVRRDVLFLTSQYPDLCKQAKKKGVKDWYHIRLRDSMGRCK